MKSISMKVGVKNERDVNREFIEAWKRTAQATAATAEVRVYFLDVATLLAVLSDRRIALLRVLRQGGPSTIRFLAKKLQRDYRNVHDDVSLLMRTGLIAKDAHCRVMVPWDSIQTEIDLAA